MKYPVWIKLLKNGKVLKAIDFIGISNCYECKYKGKRELIDVREPCLFSRDKKTWLTDKELRELDYPIVEYPEGTYEDYLSKQMIKAIDTLFEEEIKERWKR